ncbi:hypothetical protein GCM10009546_20180 [Actinomadura livida]|uniref:Uncharacterized protein n=1 Tax=Actinomadura livida TaxID=79909 RepID=A0ABN1E334_9ACTN|nr:hypothetical protein GCM10010208_02040 [Actinomadura livida]
MQDGRERHQADEGDQPPRGIGLRSRHAVPQVGDADVVHVHLGVVVAMPNIRTSWITLAFGSPRAIGESQDGTVAKTVIVPFATGVAAEGCG